MLSLLLDANVIIGLHEHDAWEHVLKKHNVNIPSIILHQETYYYYNKKGVRTHIELEGLIGVNIKELSCSAAELLDFPKQFDSVFQQEIHDGEKEAIILLQKHKDYKFCTCDCAAIKTLALLDLYNKGISFEDLIKKSGLTKKLETKYTKKFYELCYKEGSIMRIQDRGIKGKKKIK